jgi:16S rRNA (adenine1518-N6/adenine1519-N6)-dimethyltransferase
MQKKKSLGQHFLRSASYLNAVVDAADITAGDTVLEIGPGEGTLTAVLLERGARVIAIEKDSRLIPILKEKFAGKKFELIEGDALEFDTKKYLKKNKFTVVGNIPYYITGALLKKFLSEDAQPQTLVFLIQKEVAERIARSKKESILSLSVKAYGEPKYIKTVPRGAFAPAPNVDSAILRVGTISRKHFKNKKQEEKFFQLVKTGFGQKRKLLKSNLKYLLGEQAEMLGTVRAEDVAVEQWLELAKTQD